MSNEWVIPGLVLAGRVTLVLALALLTTSLMRRASAAARHFVWLLATVAVLLMPVLSLAMPEWRVVPGLSWLQATTPASSVIGTPAPAAQTPATPAAQTAAAPATQSAAVQAAAVGTGRAEAVSVDDGGAAPDAAEPLGGPAHSTSWPLLALIVWAVGAALRMAYVLAGYARVRQVARSSRRVGSGRLVDAVQEVAREFGIGRRVRVFTREDAMPITWGFLQPGVLLPEVAESWSTTRLQAVLRHELAHVARADALTQMLAEWMCALHWYNPLAWLTGSRLRAEREHACDDFVVLRGARASDYAGELLALARSYGPSAGRAHAAMAMARRSTLNARLRALLDEGRSRSRVGGRTAAAFTGIAALVVLPLSGLAPSHEPPRPPAPDPVAAGAPASPAAEPAGATLPESVTMPAASTLTADRQQETTCLQRHRTGHNSMSVTGKDGVYRLSYDRGDCDGEVRVSGELRFNDDFTRLVGISRGGSVRMEENYGGESRRLDIAPDGNGLRYTWRVNGKEQPFDAAGRQWLSAMLVGMFRQMGFMADERALSILQRQGVDGLLREANLLESDHVQWQYLKVAIQRGHLDDAGVRRVLDMAGRMLDSDHYLASLLTAVADQFQFNDATRDAFLRAAGTLESDHYRHQVLIAVLTKGDLTPAQVATVLDYSTAIESDHYRASVLMSVADRYGMNAAVRAAYLKAAQEIDSDHYKAQVLDKLLDGSKLTPDQVAEVIAAASSIQSDTYLAGILNKIDVASLTSPALQQAFLRAASTLDSDHYMHEVLVHYLDARTLSPAQLGFVLTAAKQIDSDHYLADVMVRIAQKYPLEGDTRQQFLRLMDSIESEHYHGQVASALLRAQRG